MSGVCDAFVAKSVSGVCVDVAVLCLHLVDVVGVVAFRVFLGW